jgi:F-type H+-transporting ATPase subunit gamma|tara:strand:+ start:272 stop:1132 length:861 start_codon:yes stop_codon:yes gene_type:complete
MPSIKEIKNRIGSVSSTQQLTKAMKMVAAAKLKRAQDKVIQLRPFSQKLSLVLSNVSSSGSINNEFFTERDVKNILVIVIGSDKGLCGSFNSNIFKKFDLLAKDDAYNSKILTVLPIGKKVNDFFKKTKYKTIHDYWDVLKEFNYEKASEITDNIMNMFKSGEIDKVDIIFNEFKNVAVQNTIAEFFLPVIKSPENNNSTYNYIFEPEKNKIISDLIPQTLKTQFFKSVLESSASEQGSRMTAMSQATDNAGELLKELKLTYNRSRQAAITKEILEIVGGSEALNN